MVDAILDAVDQTLGDRPIVTTDRAMTREAVCYVLERADRRLPIVVLTTVVGLADHQLLASVGCPITGDDHLMIPHGPAPASLVAELCAAREGEPWEGLVAVDGRDAILMNAPAPRRLSRGQREALDEAIDLVLKRPANTVLESVDAACPAWWPNVGRVVPLAQSFETHGASFADAEKWVAELRSYNDPLQ